MAKQIQKYKVLKDTAEKKGWFFPKTDFCDGTESSNLFTGDYTIEGFEKSFIIERKATTAEFAQNVNEPRFEAEMQRLETFKHPFLIFEFTEKDIFTFPVNSGIPKFLWRKLRVTSKYLQSVINRYTIMYKTKIIFAGHNGMKEAENLFSLVMKYAERNPEIPRAE